MNKRTVLFVDDEQKVLKGIRRMLYPLASDWNMLYVESSAEALQVMAQTRINVLITDMRIPDINGFELMDIVRNRFPEVVRVMLTGQPDKDMYYEVMSICHYFLWKPASFEVLEVLLGRIKNLESSLLDDKLVQLVGRITSLPSLPTLFSRLTELLSQSNTDSSQIAAVIRHDMSMSSQVLKLVNSAFFSLSKPITSLEDAITYLGLDTIRNLALMQHLFSQFTPAEYQEYGLNQLWQNSFYVASLTEKIVSTQSKTRTPCNASPYIAGLLVNIGKLIFVRHFPEVYRKIIAEAALGVRSEFEIEREHLGVSHADIGGYLTSLWGLPREIVEAITLHHQLPVFSGDSPILEAVWHANRICHGDFSLSDHNYAAYALGKQLVASIKPSQSFS